MTRRMVNDTQGECMGCVPVLVGEHVVQYIVSHLQGSITNNQAMPITSQKIEVLNYNTAGA